MLPFAHAKPAGHDTHDVPSPVENLPNSHTEHDADAGTGLKLPAAHGAQVPVTPPALAVPAAHSTHAPLTSAYPGRHDVPTPDTTRHVPHPGPHRPVNMLHGVHCCTAPKLNDDPTAVALTLKCPWPNGVPTPSHTLHEMSPGLEYVPAGHTATPSAPPAQYDPAGHWVHWNAPTSPYDGLLLYVPGGQYVHALDDVAPCIAEYRPSGQAWHAELPPALNHPRGHSVHVLEAATNPNPATQLDGVPDVTAQVAVPTPPTDVAALHGVHAPASARLYVPVAHEWQSKSPSPEYVPAAHGTGGELLPCRHLKPGGHTEQCDAPPMLYRPTSQSVHAVLPYPVAYLPTLHGVHDGLDPPLLDVPASHGAALPLASSL